MLLLHFMLNVGRLCAAQVNLLKLRWQLYTLKRELDL